MKTELFETLFKPGEFEKAGFAFRVNGNILKRKLFENDDVTIII